MPATIIAEGKTKFVVDASNKDVPDHGCATCQKVLIVSKDDITAGDGLNREALSGKARAANMTTVNVFKLLRAKGIPTHFLSWFDDKSFLALRAGMIPFEVVTRRIATGSFLKRNPGANEGQRFRTLEYELFYKDDSRHDPLVKFDSPWYDCFNLYEAGEPVSDESRIELLDMWPLLRSVDYDQMRIIALQVFLILEEAWKKLGVVLYDMKIEFGLVDDGLGGKRLVVADVIDNDSWRIKDAEGGQLDKQVFRDAAKAGITDDDLQKISENYELVAILSERLPEMARRCM